MLPRPRVPRDRRPARSCRVPQTGRGWPAAAPAWKPAPAGACSPSVTPAPWGFLLPVQEMIHLTQEVTVRK